MRFQVIVGVATEFSRPALGRIGLAALVVALLIVVPIASVVRHRGRSWTFVETPTGFIARPVEVVSESGQRGSIRANLMSTDRIATQGVLALVAELAENDER